LGLLIANTVGVPKWAGAGLRVEFYIKTGIVLLGASLPLTLIAWAGPGRHRAGGHRLAGDLRCHLFQSPFGSGSTAAWRQRAGHRRGGLRRLRLDRHRRRRRRQKGTRFGRHLAGGRSGPS
jgi:hypothetical protein